MVETDTFDIVESYIAPTEFTLDEHLVKQGTLAVWELIKSGDLCGLSIGVLLLLMNKLKMIPVHGITIN